MASLCVCCALFAPLSQKPLRIFWSQSPYFVNLSNFILQFIKVHKQQIVCNMLQFPNKLCIRRHSTECFLPVPPQRPTQICSCCLLGLVFTQRPLSMVLTSLVLGFKFHTHLGFRKDHLGVYPSGVDQLCVCIANDIFPVPFLHKEWVAMSLNTNSSYWCSNRQPRARTHTE